MSVAVDKPKNSDAATIALLKWIFAALFLLNGAALIVAEKMDGIRGGLLGGFRSNYAAGLICAIVGGLCWMLSQGSIPKHETEEEWNGAPPEQRGARDQAIAFGAFAIMLWVASLTTFVTGCEHLSWSPGGDRIPKLVHSAAGTDRHRGVAG